ncbi:MAG: uracil-DNA glycosylase [Brumimicrobium sp.]|nr:uracil-DNA glycosylase [Brumimicrobium sp.]
MKVDIEESWKSRLAPEFEKFYFQELVRFVRKEYSENTCYPPARRIFSAFDHSPFEKTKVVILGQDPYHRPNQANGLCFSVSDGIEFPPSLQNIFKEIKKEYDYSLPNSGNLERWAKQGVLLLNTTLTVREGEPGSHQGKGWEVFTDKVIQVISEERKDLIFLLWGGFAKQKVKHIDTNKHHVLKSGHPSPLSANRGLWFGNDHFIKTNRILSSLGKETIDWS